MRHDKRRRDIKTKLVAAICMLLVSSIMMVSTTYAWFTLSTAPEVTGINTSVGANGNLEMALLSTANTFNQPDSMIQSAVGDSMDVANKDVKAANVTWGNLVNLSDSGYGLNTISLLPAAVDISGGTMAKQFLQTPKYGSDGRVTELTTQSVLAPFNGTSFTEVDTNTANGYDAGKTIEYGVRAVGTSSNMSVRKAAMTQALSSAGIAANNASRAASEMLAFYGTGLANLAAGQAMGGKESFSKSDVAVIADILNALEGYSYEEPKADGEGTNTVTVPGLFDQIKEALAYYYVAEFSSTLNTATMTDEEFQEQVTALGSATLESIKASVKSAKLSAAIAEYEALATETAEARAAYNTMIGTGDSYTWAQVKAVVDKIVEIDSMQICKLTIDQMKADENTENELYGLDVDVLMSAYETYGLTVDMYDGAFTTLANLVGAFNGKINLTLPLLGDREATMRVNPEVTPNRLSAASAEIVAAGAPEAGEDAVSTITDKYAYVIDLAFRTNAAESDLMLQTAAAQRISDSTSKTTQGAGSYMTFTSGNENFTAENMKHLMKNIKVVFYTESGEGDFYDVLAVAGIDADSGEVGSSGKFATVKANLYLLDENGDYITTQEDADIVELEANKAQIVHVLVYLDGTTISNKHVANGMQSMVGTMNLQFSSSEQLTPMKYSEFNTAVSGG